MYGIHFFENNTFDLVRFSKYIPSVDEDIKIKDPNERESCLVLAA